MKTPLVEYLEQRSTLEKQFLLGVTALLFSISTYFAGAAQSVPLGSTQFMPSPEQPIGWRGDGTGRYPAARPRKSPPTA